MSKSQYVETVWFVVLHSQGISLVEAAAMVGDGEFQVVEYGAGNSSNGEMWHASLAVVAGLLRLLTLDGTAANEGNMGSGGSEPITSGEADSGAGMSGRRKEGIGKGGSRNEGEDAKAGVTCDANPHGEGEGTKEAASCIEVDVEKAEVGGEGCWVRLKLVTLTPCSAQRAQSRAVAFCLFSRFMLASCCFAILSFSLFSHSLTLAIASESFMLSA